MAQRDGSSPGFSAAAVSLWIEQNLWSKRRVSVTNEELMAAGLSRDSILTVAQRIVDITEGTQCTYNKGNHILRVGEKGTSMYFIESGKAKVVSGDTKQTHLVMKVPGNGFGEWGMLYAENRTASVVAEETCVIREMTREKYLQSCAELTQFKFCLERVALRQWKSLQSDHPQSETRKAHFIGRDGYKCTIHNLPTFLKKFNNTVVRPRRLPELSASNQVQFEVPIDVVGEQVVLVVGEDKLEVTLDLAPVHAKSQNKKKGQLSNSSVKWAIQDLCAQLRTAILKSTKQGGIEVENVFAQFDTDGNGLLDKDELLAGCYFLNIDVTMTEINAMWPIIDTSGDGQVECEEFVNFVKKSGRQGHATVGTFKMHQANLDRLSHLNSQSQRSQRIKRRPETKNEDPATPDSPLPSIRQKKSKRHARPSPAHGKVGTSKSTKQLTDFNAPPSPLSFNTGGRSESELLPHMPSNRVSVAPHGKNRLQDAELKKLPAMESCYQWRRGVSSWQAHFAKVPKKTQLGF